MNPRDVCPFGGDRCRDCDGTCWREADDLTGSWPVEGDDE